MIAKPVRAIRDVFTKPFENAPLAGVALVGRATQGALAGAVSVPPPTSRIPGSTPPTDIPMKLARLAFACFAPWMAPAAFAAAYTYHGELLDGDAPAQGAYEMRLRTLARPGDATPMSETIVSVDAVDGRFSARRSCRRRATTRCGSTSPCAPRRMATSYR